MSTNLTAFPLTGETIADLTTAAPANTQNLEVDNSGTSAKVTVSALTAHINGQQNWSQIQGKPSFFDGNYNSLSNRPSLFDGDYNSLSNQPSLFDGAYSSLTGKPSLFDGAFSSLSGRPTTRAGYGITDAQPLDSDLTAVADLTTTGLIERTGTGTAATAVVTAYGKTLISAVNAGAAQSALALVPGANVQAWNTRLDSVAGLSASSGGVEKTGANTFGSYTLTSFAKTLLDDPNAATAQATLGLAIGSNVQAWNTRLDSVAGLSASSGGVEKTGVNTFGSYTLSTFGKSLIDDADAAAGRATLLLGDLAVKSSIFDTDVAGLAGIAWGKISKSGAVPGDVGAAAAAHTHIQSVVNLTLLNGFLGFFSLYPNDTMRICFVQFQLVRPGGLPAVGTNICTFSSAYMPLSSPAWMGSGVISGVAQHVRIFSDATTFKWQLLSGSGTAVDYVEGSMVWRY